MIILEVNNVQYDGFTSISVTRSIEDISGVFSFSAVSSSNFNFPIKLFDSCSVIVDGTTVITGFVEEININYDAGTHSVDIRGRDKTADIIDSRLGDEIEFNTPISLEQVAQKVLSAINLTGVSVSTNTTLKDYEQGEKVSSKIGQSAFDFIEQYARKRQVLTTTDGLGNIVFAQAGTSSIRVTLSNQINNPSVNNILSANVQFNSTERFNKYIVRSQDNISAANELGSQSVQNQTNRISDATDAEVRPSRVFNFIAENATNTEEAKTRAEWEGNIRKTRGFNYTCTVQGHSIEGTVWVPNRLVRVIDDFADINSQLLISQVTYDLSTDNGSTTTLVLVSKESYTLALEQAQRDAQSNNDGSEYT